MLVLVVVVVAARGLGGSSDESGSNGGSPAGEDGCPTGGPTVRVDTFTPEVLVSVMPADPSGSIVYDLTVDFEVTNETSAPIRVETIEAAVFNHPDATVVAYGGLEAIPPGETATVDGQTNVVVEGATATGPPTPDPGSIELTAAWADADLYSCDPPRQGR